MSQGGNVGFYDRVTGKTRFVKPNHSDPAVTLRFNWNAAIAQDPYKDCGVYFGSQFVHYSDDCGVSWKIISPDLTTNDPSKQKADQSGGLTMDATNAENHTTILAIAPSPVDKDVIWVGTDDGNLQLTRDGGKTWTNLSSNLKALPGGSWIPQIEVNSKNAGEAFVVANNYRRNDYAAYAYHTVDYGKSWRRIADDSKIASFVLSIVQDPVEPDLLFLGTDAGLYVSFDKGNNWKHWNKGFPQVQVNDMKIHPREHDLVLGTFGRAFWVLDDIRPLRAIASEGEKALDADFKVFDAPDAIQVSMRSYDGIRFRAQNEFIGDNKSFDQILASVWKKPAEKKDESNEEKPDKKQKVKVNVYDSEGKMVRNYSRNIEDGLNKIRWGLETNGVRYPSRREVKDDDDPPGGPAVLPGKYKMVFEFDKKWDSIWVNVLADPRSDIKSQDRAGIREMQMQLQSLAESATKSFDKIQNAKKSIEIVEKLLANQPDSTKKEIKALHKSLNTALDSLSNMFMSPENQKGIQRNPDELNSVLRGAGQYIGSSWETPGQNAQYAFEKAKMRTEEVTSAVNSFMDKEWAEYKVKVETLTLTVFKNE